MRILLSLAAVMLVLSAAFFALAKDDGSPPGYTGSPANGRDCTQCHTGVTNSGPGTTSIQGPSVYTPGSIVPITVSLRNGRRSLASNGFQIAAFAGSTVLPGWTPVDSQTRVDSNYLNQRRDNGTTWTAYFQMPSTAQSFAFYSAYLDSDNRGSRSNDDTYTTSLAVTPGVVNLSMMGLPRRGTSVPLALESPSDANKQYAMAASFGNTGFNVGPKFIPLDADSLFLATVNNLLPGLFVNFRGALDASGKASAQVVLPNLGALAGVRLYCAFIVVDNGIGTVSNPVELIIL